MEMSIIVSTSCVSMPAMLTLIDGGKISPVLVGYLFNSHINLLSFIWTKRARE